MAYMLLGVAQVVGLILIPFGLPGLWLQVASLAVFAWATHFTTMSWMPLVAVFLLALGAELAEFLLGGQFAKRYGGGARAAWGAILGGIVGALLGVPVPVVGSVIGAFLGSFVGAAVFEFSSRREWQGAMRAGWGALLGRLAATAVKSSVGVVVATIALLSAL